MLRTRENSDVFNSLDEIYLVFTSKKQISSIYFKLKVKFQWFLPIYDHFSLYIIQSVGKADGLLVCVWP